MAVPLRPHARRRTRGAPSRSIYRETPFAGPLAQVAVCAWDGLTGWGRGLRLLPDAAVDLVWTGEALMVEPASAAAVRRAVPPGRRHTGLRFRPGAAGAVLGVALHELAAEPVALHELWGARAAMVEERLALARPSDRAGLLADLVAGRLGLGARPDGRIEAAIRALAAPSARVDDAARLVGLPSRDLRRRFHQEVGLSPKAVQRILRFHRALSDLRRPGADLAQAAAAAGYADQAHMTHEFRRLADATPAALLRAA